MKELKDRWGSNLDIAASIAALFAVWEKKKKRLHVM